MSPIPTMLKIRSRSPALQPVPMIRPTHKFMKYPERKYHADANVEPTGPAPITIRPVTFSGAGGVGIKQFPS